MKKIIMKIIELNFNDWGHNEWITAIAIILFFVGYVLYGIWQMQSRFKKKLFLEKIGIRKKREKTKNTNDSQNSEKNKGDKK